MTSEALRDLVIDALEELKGRDILYPAGRGHHRYHRLHGLCQWHVEPSRQSTCQQCRRNGQRTGCRYPSASKVVRANEWVLVDLGDVLVHVMQSDTRKFYDLERLWTEISV